MLVDAKILKDLRALTDILRRLDNTTHRRYTGDIRGATHYLQNLCARLERAAQLLQKLETYRGHGFNLSAVLARRYPDAERMEKELTVLIQKMEDLVPIITEYRRRRVEFLVPARQKFEALITDPEKHREIKSLWYKMTEDI